MLPHRFGNSPLGFSQVEEFIHHGHIDAAGAGRTVAADVYKRQERGIFLVNRGLDVCPYITLPALLLLLGSGTVAALTAAAMVLVYPLTVIAALL